jgi:hypothetical protein
MGFRTTCEAHADFFFGQNTCFMLVQEKKYQNGIILKDKKLKVSTYVIFCRPEVQYRYRLMFSMVPGYGRT